LRDGLRRRRIAAHQVVSGSLRRQRDTAAPLAEAAGLQVATDPRLDEYDDRDILGHYAETTVGLERHAGDAEISSRDFQLILNRALLRWIAAGEDSPCREPWPAFAGRVRAALNAVADGLTKGQTALVVSSGGAIAALTAALMQLPSEALVAFNHVSINTGLSKVTVGRGGITLVSSNEHAHLEEADPRLISYR
jgi:broad specificity phosphatase PhoE